MLIEATVSMLTEDKTTQILIRLVDIVDRIKVIPLF